jgi:hypothetical protein
MIVPIPGWLIATVSFPGVIVHEAAHMLFCRLRRVAVLDVCFFRVGNPAGYVVHEPPHDFTTAFFISTGPFFVNSALCILICFPAFMPSRVFNCMDPVQGFLLWLGLSIGMHAFPSTHDAQQLWAAASDAARRFNLLAIVSFPLVVVIFIANVLSIIWFDLIYAAAIGLGLPELVFKHLT